MKRSLFRPLFLSLNWRLPSPSTLIVFGILMISASALAAESDAETRATSGTSALEAPIETKTEETPYIFKIPAPRGQILDCQGQPLARMVTVHRLMVEAPVLPEETWDAYFLKLKERWTSIEKAYPGAKLPDEDAIAEHYEHRRKLPMPTLGTFDEAFMKSHPESLVPGVRWRAEYQRDYPNGTFAAHLIGYIAPTSPPLKGPLHHGEALWKEVTGKDGLEKAYDESLAGKPGLLLVTAEKSTGKVRETVMIPPKPGQDVVTTLHREIQRTAESALASAKRPGALVVVEPRTGNILAMASYPTFAPGDFARGMSHEEFEKMTKDPNGPLNHRAIAGLYPPGSVFKPFVALACLESGRLQSTTRFACGPSYVIDGRSFGNWSDTDRGWFDLYAAMVRSCNPYFYQAALATGAAPVQTTLKAFGFGQRDDFPLESYAGGNVPKKVPNRQALANLSIGQGDVLTSPLQVAVAMGALTNGQGRMRPRLMTLVQDQQKQVLAATTPTWQERFAFSPVHLEEVRMGMYGVVNHEQGTGSKARLAKQRVFGKTGTAEWSNRGKRANMVWFAGFVPDCDPPLAYALALEGKPGEKVSGGLTAAPTVGQFLTQVFQDPGRHGIRPGSMVAPLEKGALTPPEIPAPTPEALAPPVLAQEGVPGSPVINVVSANRALPVSGLPPEVMPAPQSSAASPAVTLTTRGSPGGIPETVVVPRAQPVAAQEAPRFAETTPPAADTRARPRRSPVGMGNGIVITSTGGNRGTPVTRQRQVAAEALPPPVEEVPVPVAEALPPEVSLASEPSPPPATAAVRGNKPARMPKHVPKATAVAEEPLPEPILTQEPPSASLAPRTTKSSARSATATAAPRAIPMEAPLDPTMSTAEAAPPPPPAPEPRKRKFRLFGGDDDDD